MVNNGPSLRHVLSLGADGVSFSNQLFWKSFRTELCSHGQRTMQPTKPPAGGKEMAKPKDLSHSEVQWVGTSKYWIWWGRHNLAYNKQYILAGTESHRIVPCPTYSCLPPCEPLATIDPFTISIVLPFPECVIVEIIHYVAFSYWHLSLSNIRLSSLPFCGWIFHFFLSMNIHWFYMSTTMFLISKISVLCLYRFACLFYVFLLTHFCDPMCYFFKHSCVVIFVSCGW